MSGAAAMKKVFSIGDNFSVWWADKLFSYPGVYVWWRKGYIITPRGYKHD